jgi:hypothetical protein
MNKRTLYWVCYPFGCVVIIVVGLIGLIGVALSFFAYAVDDGLTKFESWCFDE